MVRENNSRKRSYFSPHTQHVFWVGLFLPSCSQSRWLQTPHSPLFPLLLTLLTCCFLFFPDSPLERLQALPFKCPSLHTHKILPYKHVPFLSKKAKSFSFLQRTPINLVCCSPKDANRQSPSCYPTTVF